MRGWRGTARKVRAALVLVGAVLGPWVAAAARAGEPADPRDGRGWGLGSDVQQVAPGEQVALFNGVPSFHRTLASWPEPGGLKLEFTLDYSGAVPHHRFDISPASGHVDLEAAFGEWSLGLNGHVLWTANLSPFLYNGEVPGQPHRDEKGLVVDGCWRTCGFSICDKAYASGGSNGDVELATSEGGTAEFAYAGNRPAGGDPALLPCDPASAWRACLPGPAQTGRTLRVKQPDGSTWSFQEVPLTLRWPEYWYNGNEGPRAFRLARVDGPTPECYALVSYEYADSGGDRNRYLHPTRVRVTDASGRALEFQITANLASGTCDVLAISSWGAPNQYLSFRSRGYTDRAGQPRRSYLFYLDYFTDRAARATSFHYQDDDRAEAWYASCSDSADIHAQRLSGVDYPEGGGSSYSYVPLPATRPGCPDPSLRYEDAGWIATGRSPCIAPMVDRVEIREAPGGAPVQQLALAYTWNQAPAVGAPSESEAYRYFTRVDYNPGPGIPPRAPRRAGGAGAAGGPPAPRPLRGLDGGPQQFSVSHTFRKFPYQPRYHGEPARDRWAVRMIETGVLLASGEQHTLATEFDALAQGGRYAGTLLPARRTYTVTSTGPPASYSAATEYDSLARVVASTDPLGVRTVMEYYDPPELHSPWSGPGRYSVLLPARRRALAPGSGEVLADSWYDREPLYGRALAVHTLLEGARVATVTQAYDPAQPADLVQVTSAMGLVTEYDYATQLIPNTIYYAGCPGGALPAHTVLHPDAGHTLDLYQAYDYEGRLLREADGAGRVTFLGYDAEGRPRTVARAGDFMTGPPSRPGAGAPQLPPYGLVPCPSSVLTYADAPGHSSVRTALYPATRESLLAVSDVDGLGRTRATRCADAPGSERSFSFDSFGRVARATAPDGRGSDYAYDELGRPILVSGDAGGACAVEHHTVADPSGYGLRLPAGAPAGYWTVQLTRHAGGRTSLRALDPRGLAWAEAEYGPDLAQPVVARYYEHDLLGRLVAVHAPDGSVTRLDYDRAGSRRHVWLPGGACRTTVSDLDGRPVLQQDERAAAEQGWACLRLDGAGRVLQEGYVTGLSESAAQGYADAGQWPPGVSWRSRFTYDAGLSTNNLGCLSRMETLAAGAPVDACDFLSDVRKRVISKTLTLAGAPRPLTVAYEYDRLDRLTALTYPDGRRICFSYDPVGGRLARISEGPSRTLVTLGRDASGRVVSASNGALAIAWSYNAAGLLALQTGAVGTRAVFQEAFDYDADGRRSGRLARGSERLEFQRDAAARLVGVRFASELGWPALAYRYAPGGGLDSVGSDLENVVASLSGARVQRLDRLPLGRELWSYDAHGNVVRRTSVLGADTLGGLTLGYSDANRMVSASGWAGDVADSARYAYDAHGWRVRRAVGGVRTFQVRDESGDLLAEVDSAGRVVRDYVRVGGRVLGVLEADDSYTAYLTDVMGSVRLGVDERGVLRFEQEFLPFGELSRFDGEERPTLGFLGSEQDPETGYCYLKQRYYDPAAGRFLTPDPLWDSGADPYAYAWDDPLTFSDPEGLAGGPGDDTPTAKTDIHTLPAILVVAQHLLPHELLDAVRALRVVYADCVAERLADRYRSYRSALQVCRQLVDGTQVDGAGQPLECTLHRLEHTAARTAHAVIRSTLASPSTQQTLNRLMLAHELIAGARVCLALQRARGLSPSERLNIRLEAEAVILGEVTVDLAGLAAADLGLAAPAPGALALFAWGGVRGDVSDLSDAILSRTVPGYAQTSILDRLFGPVLDAPGPERP